MVPRVHVDRRRRRLELEEDDTVVGREQVKRRASIRVARHRVGTGRQQKAKRAGVGAHVYRLHADAIGQVDLRASLQQQVDDARVTLVLGEAAEARVVEASPAGVIAGAQVQRGTNGGGEEEAAERQDNRKGSEELSTPPPPSHSGRRALGYCLVG